MVKHKRGKTKKGFTLAEVLIVAAVLATLATISVLGYNGVQRNARNSQTIQVARKWQDLLKVYFSKNPQIELAGVNPSKEGICMGEAANFPATDGFAAGECIKTTTAGRTGITNSEVYQKVSLVSEASGLTSTVTVSSDSETIKYRGVYYKGDLTYVLEGEDTPCVLTTLYTYSENGATWCYLKVSDQDSQMIVYPSDFN